MRRNPGPWRLPRCGCQNPLFPRPSVTLISGVPLFRPGLVALLMAAVAASAAAPDFNREIRPILAGHCFGCHGPDEAARKGGLRLDDRGEALRGGKSGEPALVPGDPAGSSLLARVRSHDPDEQMPPGSEKNPLSASQAEILERWIASGAAYEVGRAHV